MCLYRAIEINRLNAFEVSGTKQQQAFRNPVGTDFFIVQDENVWQQQQKQHKLAKKKKRERDEG